MLLFFFVAFFYVVLSQLNYMAALFKHLSLKCEKNSFFFLFKMSTSVHKRVRQRLLGDFFFFNLLFSHCQVLAQGIKTGACGPAGSCSILHGAVV